MLQRRLLFVIRIAIQEIQADGPTFVLSSQLAQNDSLSPEATLVYRSPSELLLSRKT